MRITPEKKVESEVRAWAFAQGWDLEVYDSKATFSKAKGCYSRNRGLAVGTPDLLGLDQTGLFVAVELKAPGKENQCRVEQYNFLLRKIEKNGFACVVSSVETLALLYSEFLKVRQFSLLDSRQLLKNHLPKKVVSNGKVISVL